MKVKEIMNKVIAIEHNISLREAAKIMSKKNIGSLVILKKDKIVGIITEKDIVDNASSLDKKVSSFIKDNIITVDANDSLENAACLMSKYKIKRLPVLENDKLVGIITATDLLAHSEEIETDFFFD
ncbi:MAG: CBS domain-containing protein [Candidatus Pacearchaeota archaeon]